MVIVVYYQHYRLYSLLPPVAFHFANEVDVEVALKERAEG